MDDHGGIVCLGGPFAADAELGWMDHEMSLIREAHERQLPVIGICLGHQLIARALGGEVARLETPEWGFGNLSLTFPGQTETILAGMPWDHPQFHTHEWEVTKAPAGATVLAASTKSRIQAFRVGVRTFGFQFHFEYDKPTIRGLVESEAAFMQKAGVTGEELEAQLAESYGKFVRHSERLCVNLTTLAFTFQDLLRA